MAAVGRPECLDFLQFQDILRKMRELDDKIIYTLNATLPTESFRNQSDSSTACKELFGQLQQNFNKREQAIQECITFARDKLVDLKKKKESNGNDISVLKELRKEQSKIRLLQTELGVEEVLKDKTSRVLYERFVLDSEFLFDDGWCSVSAHSRSLFPQEGYFKQFKPASITLYEQVEEKE